MKLLETVKMAAKPHEDEIIDIDPASEYEQSDNNDST